MTGPRHAGVRGVILAEVVIAVVILAAFVAATAALHRASRERQTETLAKLKSLGDARSALGRAVLETHDRRYVEILHQPSDAAAGAPSLTKSPFAYPGVEGLVVVRYVAGQGEKTQGPFEVILRAGDKSSP